ncbi:MAG: sulfatase-like hydrolase/transferase [Eubacteriales bacterium]
MEKMNLIIITPDQMRADYLGCYGNTMVKTPHIDKLANKGVRFDKMYCAAPLCGPSRCSFATSTYFSEHNHRNYWSTISPDVPNIATSLKKAGYQTGMFGKNHLFTYERLGEVWDQLDEVCLGNYDGHPEYVHSFSSFTLADDHEFNITGRLTTEGIDFIKGCEEKPFFLWLNYQDPHPAFCCPKPYDMMYDPKDIVLSKRVSEYVKERQPVKNEVFRIHSEMDLCTEDDLRKAIAHYMGQISYVDDSVGRIIDSLKETGNDKKTVILFFSDHGELLGDYGMTHKNPTFYDCLSRIPAILVHPDGRWESETFSGLTEEVDMVPTILETLGVEIPPTMVGKSWKKDLDQKDFVGKKNIICEAGGGNPTYKEPVEGHIINAPHAPTSFGVGAMIREGDYKLSIYGDDICELYNLAQDPDELYNLYDCDGYEKIQNHLTLALLKRIMSVKVRDIGMDWTYSEYPYDVRFEPLENVGAVLEDVRASGDYMN